MDIAECSNQNEFAQLSQLIDRIYKSALNPNLWEKTLSAMADWVGAPMAMLFTPTVLPAEGGFYFNYGIPEAAMELLRTRYQPSDLWTTAAIQQNRLQEGLVFTGNDVVRMEELTRSIWYKEFLSPIGIDQVLTNIVYGLDSAMHHPTALSYFRNLDDNLFSERDRWRSSLLLPHLSGALGATARLRNTECQLATSLIALDRLYQGVLLIGKNDEVLFGNKAALRILNLDDGLRLQSINQQKLTYLIAKQHIVQQYLDQAIREVVRPNLLSAQHFSKTIQVPRSSGRAPLTINLSPLPVKHGFAIDSDNNPKAIAFISDSSAPICLNHTVLKDAFGLTKAEIRTAELVLDGRCLEDMSGECGLSVNTLKTHLSRVYSKTNATNRADLVKLLITLARAPS